jgi:RimJ/RimL family protein N-acetyltransferase
MAVIPSRHVRLKDDRQVTLRSAQPEDAAAIRDLVAEVFNSSPFLLTEPDEFTATVEEERDWIQGFITAPGRLLLVAESKAIRPDLLGILDFRNHDSRRRIAHTGLMGMSVRSDCRSLGLGSLLLNELIEWARQVNFLNRIELSVIEGNDTAVKLYRKFGFIEEGRKRAAIHLGGGRYVDEILMACFVRQSASAMEPN